MEELSNFIMKTLGVSYETLPLERIKEMFQQFKSNNTNKLNNKENDKEKDKKQEKANSNPFDIYSFQSYDVITLTQQENKLSDLSKNNIIITSKVSDPKLEDVGLFLSKPTYSYRVQCSEIDSDVRRTYKDFEWLKSQLNLRYSLRFVPPILKDFNLINFGLINKKENNDINENKNVRYLNKFLNSLLQKKIFRTSPIIYEFLILDGKTFKKYKNLVDKKGYELSINLDNLLSTKGVIHCEMKRDNVFWANQINKKYSELSEMYNRLDSFIDNIANDFQNLTLHLKDINEIFKKLSESFKGIPESYGLDDIYISYQKLFNNWSNNFSKESEFFRKELKECFNYISMELQEIDQIYKQYITFRDEYESFSEIINKKKEELFQQKDTRNWGLLPGTEHQIEMIENDKKLSFERMLYKETKLLNEEKKRLACTIHLMKKQYGKLIKYQSGIIRNNFTILKDNFNLSLKNNSFQDKFKSEK